MDLSILGWERGEKKQIKFVLAIWDGNRNFQKLFPLFGKGAGITKKLSRYSEQEQ